MLTLISRKLHEAEGRLSTFFLPPNHAGAPGSPKRNHQLRIKRKVEELWDPGSASNLQTREFAGAGENQGGLKWNVAVWGRLGLKRLS